MLDPVASEMESFVILVKSKRAQEGSDWGVVGFLDMFWLLFRFKIYLIKNITLINL